MATTTGDAVASSKGLFVRNATGLVRSWATFDAFIYSFFSINLVCLGWDIFSFGPYTAPGGNLLTAIVISSALVLLEVVVYAGLISVMPRAGGDYVWQTRVLGGPIGFVLAITGWVFILWLWVPIYGNIFSIEFISPVCTILADWTGNSTFATWAQDATTNGGYMISSLVVAAFAAVVIALGMKVYSRIQRFCFYGGMLGLGVMFLLLLFSSHTSFVNGWNHFGSAVFGAKGNAYAQTLSAAKKAGYTPVPLHSLALGGSWALIPLLLFWNLWPNWGATLSGEVRGASDYTRNLRAMTLSVVVCAVLAVVSILLVAHATSTTFFYDANFLGSANSSMPIWPYPGLLAAFLTTNHVLQMFIVLSLSLWFFGWAGTVFLSSTRVIFAAAFDRALPDRFAEVSRNGAPLVALATMLIPGVILSILYCYNIHGFRTVTLDATLVIAVTFLGSTVAAIILPWRMKRIYDSSPLARYQIAGIPIITLAGVGFLLFLVWNIYEWLSNSVYAVNDHTSLVFLGILYAVAIVLYAGTRYFRRQSGVDLSAVHKEIPVE